MPTTTVSPTNQPATVPSQSEDQPRPQDPLKKKWPRFKGKVKEDKLKKETKRRFCYEPHEWQLRAALKVLEGNDGVVVAGTGKGKTIIFALLGLLPHSSIHRVQPKAHLCKIHISPQLSTKPTLPGVNCYQRPALGKFHALTSLQCSPHCHPTAVKQLHHSSPTEEASLSR